MNDQVPSKEQTISVAELREARHFKNDPQYLVDIAGLAATQIERLETALREVVKERDTARLLLDEARAALEPPAVPTGWVLGEGRITSADPSDPSKPPDARPWAPLYRHAPPPAPEPHVIKQIEHAIEDCPGSVTRQFADYIRGCISDYRHALTKGDGQ
jgi:hypothetical protein